MEKQPLISVIVPVYNTAPWLRKCLDSICGQTYQNLEILCVNDGSSDESAEILAEYAAKDSRIKVFTQENAGLSAARNTGLEHATGEWVTGVDSDDYIAADIYEKAMAQAKTGVDWIFFGVRSVDEQGEPQERDAYFALPQTGEYVVDPLLVEKLNVCFWSKLWRRDIIEKNNLRFPVGLVHEDEAMFYLYAPLVHKLAVCDDIGYFYVQREGSIMHDTSQSQQQKYMRYVPVLSFCLNEYINRGWMRGAVKNYLRIMFVRLVGWMYRDAVGNECESPRMIIARLIKKAKLHEQDFRLERVIPIGRLMSCFLSRYAYSKVYRFLGVPIVLVEYDKQGQKISEKCILWSRLKAKMKSLLR